MVAARDQEVHGQQWHGEGGLQHVCLHGRQEEMEEGREIRGETLGSCGTVKTLHVSGVGGPRSSGGSWQDVSGSGVPGEVSGGLCRPGDKDLEECSSLNGGGTNQT